MIRRYLIQFLVRHLLAAVTEEDILTITNKGWFHHNRKLSQEEVHQLAEEAQSFKDSVLWGMMRNEIRYMANLLMFEKGITNKNTIFGRAMLYDLELLEKFINRCRSL